MLFGFITLVTLACVSAHSWMSCPPSFNTNPTRGGFLNGACEKWYKGGETTIKAGERLKVGWTSNNHAGGYVRIALVPEGQHKTKAFFKQNVMKIACYGMNEIAGKTKYGDCIHPCNARPGCEYQSDILDVERFDTTITIPTNLVDGTYILQTAMLVGNGQAPYYSCAKLIIHGGDPTMNCKSTAKPLAYTCHRSGGPPMEAITAGTKRGEFCYHNDKIGDVDDRILDVPINVDCDPRITCANSINAAHCFSEKGMDTIEDPWMPKQPGCGIVRPPPPPTCNDKIQNQGEHDVDCGGPCGPCPTVPPNAGRYHSKIDHVIGKWGNGKIVVFVNKDLPIGSNWVLTIQYNEPPKISGSWGGGRVVKENERGNIITFKPFFWNPLPKKGQTISIGFNANVKPDHEIHPLTMDFELDEENPADEPKRSFRDMKHIGCGKFHRCKHGYDCITETLSPCEKSPCTRSYCKEAPHGCTKKRCKPGYECVNETISPCKTYPCEFSYCKKMSSIRRK